MSSIYMEDLALLGIFGDGFFKKAADFVKRGLRNISQIEPVRQVMLNVLPKVIGSITGKIPVLEAFKDDITHALTEKAKELMGIQAEEEEKDLKVAGRRWNHITAYTSGT